jgi:hypothetical protein
MTQGPQLEDRLRVALRRPEGAGWPDEHGAFDRFLRRRARHGRALAARAGLALVVALALAAVMPRLLPRGPAGPVAPPGRVVRAPAGGFEAAVPAGWTDLARDRRILFPGKETGSGIGLRPMRRAPDTRVTVYTAILSPTQYPGIEPGADPDPSVTADPTTKKLDDDSRTLGRGRRPDGRPYVWRTRLAPLEVAEYAVAWPYRCRPGEACPPTARWRVLVVHATSAEGAATRQRVLEVVRRIVETARPVTNALPGGGPPGLVDTAVTPVEGHWLLGTGGSGRGAWQVYVRHGGDAGNEDVFELHFPSRKTRPGVGVHAEDIEPTFLLNGQLGLFRDCLSWLSPQVGLLSGAVPENVTEVRIELAGQPPLTTRAFGHDQPARWAAFVSPPLARGTSVTRVVALDASGRTVAESERDGYLSHPACHVFR